MGIVSKKTLEELNLGAVIQAVEGPIALVDCQEGPIRCAQFDTCIIKEPVHQIRTQLNQFINNISLTQFRATPALENTK
ncbi:MAG: Rrf2 family transcriptional regulator [Kiritimatiellae bacterium]|nr:Rrf2 family transcriptional regulator [Kiritimatiellia bacterium]